MSLKGLHGKVAIVTGASRGIGLGIAERLVAEGCKVVITARRPEALAEAVEALGGHDHALGIPGNAGDAEHRADVVAAAIEAFGSVDLLVNNTGINPAFGPLMELDLDAARKIMDVNAEGIDLYNTMLNTMGSTERLGPAKREHTKIDRIRA